MSTSARHRAAAGLLVVSLLAPHATAQAQPWPVCSTSDNYTANSTNQANIESLATTLPKNTSSSEMLFATSMLGSVPDIVYALALCRGDTNASACESCVAGGFLDGQKLCALNKDATLLYDPCILRYSNKNFLSFVNGGGGEFIILKPTRNASASGNKYHAVVGVLPNDGSSVIAMWNALNVSAPFVKVFDAAVAALVNATADYAAVNSSRRFGTAVVTFGSQNLTLYGLAQCTPDMTPTECRACLAGIIQEGPKYYSGRKGGRILGVRCNYRYERYAFFTGRPLLQLPEPEVVAPAPGVMNLTPPTTRGEETGRVLAILLPTVVIIVISVICYFLWRRKRNQAQMPSVVDSTNSEDLENVDLLIIDLPTIRATTENFDEGKKLGEGGFGEVYKGILPNGQEIAMKRLSQNSRQGVKELKTELVLVAKLQHKNLVKLVGVCLEEHEKLLVYEYIPNKSLDTFLFDPEKRRELDWDKRFVIINGIVQGLQYLHEESQLKIVHRDLKASNVLLDSDFSPKISDFGLARLFGMDQSQYVTNRVVGTYGYMAPEYAMRGHYSIKSDVFSFGILILEIVSGRRNGGSYDSEYYDHLLSLVWEQWTMGKFVDIMDRSLINYRPAFCFQRSNFNSDMCSRNSQSTSRSLISENEVSITEPEAR